MTLYGMLAGVDEAELCGECGCAALFHAPCCGACAVCGNKVCDEFARTYAVPVTPESEQPEPKCPHPYCSACHPSYPCRPDCHICHSGVSPEPPKEPSA